MSKLLFFESLPRELIQKEILRYVNDIDMIELYKSANKYLRPLLEQKIPEIHARRNIEKMVRCGDKIFFSYKNGRELYAIFYPTKKIIHHRCCETTNPITTVLSIHYYFKKKITRSIETDLWIMYFHCIFFCKHCFSDTIKSREKILPYVTLDVEDQITMFEFIQYATIIKSVHVGITPYSSFFKESVTIPIHSVFQDIPKRCYITDPYALSIIKQCPF